jgi:chromosomal replication initiator protein
MDNLLKALELAAGKPIALRLTALEQGDSASSIEPEEPPPPAPTGFLDKAFTFDSFVVGKSNELAHAASMTVAKHPGTYYNPLFIYGGTGLGKTHILHAIGHTIRQDMPAVQIRYVSSEDFLNDLIKAIIENRPDQFRSKYRPLKLLLIDDIHFIAGKERIQEEFFHTFNALHHKRSQIVVTSDRPPQETKLDQRLISRLESGLIADIQPPDFETRTAILKKKAAMLGLDIPNEVLMFIANSVTQNVRQLEGCLVRLSAMETTINKKIDLPLAKNILGDIIRKRNSAVSLEQIVKASADAFRVTPGNLVSKRRTSLIARARHVAMYLARKLTPLSTTDVGRYFGGRDHSTVIHAVQQIQRLIKDDDDFRSVVLSLEEQLRS